MNEQNGPNTVSVKEQQLGDELEQRGAELHNAFSDLGMLHLLEGRFEKAEDALLRSADTNPTCTKTILNLAAAVYLNHGPTEDEAHRPATLTAGHILEGTLGEQGKALLMRHLHETDLSELGENIHPYQMDMRDYIAEIEAAVAASEPQPIH
ncbi:hypothetical protein KBC31_00870 [Candidatus Saccharibacteria bacterium]|jgi:hypothetical protein|nr:hypothetical protein [Candidatus Saccharibacteria bacterium]